MLFFFCIKITLNNYSLNLRLKLHSKYMFLVIFKIVIGDYVINVKCKMILICCSLNMKKKNGYLGEELPRRRMTKAKEPTNSKV